MTARIVKGDSLSASARSVPTPTLRYAFESSGRRWFILGVMLLVVMGMAVWSVRDSPFAI